MESVFFTSSILALAGLGLVFWGALLLYITPSKHVPLELLNAVAWTDLANIERILSDANIVIAEVAPGQPTDSRTLPEIRRAIDSSQMKAYAVRFTFGKGIYLPPSYLKDSESSLVFVPSSRYEGMPNPEETHEGMLYCGKVWPEGVLLTPPGLSLSKLIEKRIGTSFTKTDLRYIQGKLPKLLTEGMEIADAMDIDTDSNPIAMEVTNHVFSEICQETRKMEKVHEAVGCPMCSAMACALAKATKKPVSIEAEEQSKDGKTTRIQFKIMEDQEWRSR